MKRFGIGALALVLTTVVGCSSTVSGTPRAASDPDARAAVARSVLTVGDLPSGWAVHHDDSAGGSPTGCRPANIGMHSSAKKDAEFEYAGSLPLLLETVAYFHGDTAPAAFTAGIRSITACKRLTIAPGQSAPLVPMTLPTFGDRSAAYSLTFHESGLSVQMALCAVQRSHFIALIAYGDLGAVDRTQLLDLVHRAVAKLH